MRHALSGYSQRLYESALAICRGLAFFQRLSHYQIMNFISLSPFSILAQAAPSPGGGGFAGLLPIILLFVGMWFLIIAPQRKRQKAHDKMLKELKKGDDVVTSGGLHAKITHVGDESLTVEIAEELRLSWARPL